MLRGTLPFSANFIIYYLKTVKTSTSLPQESNTKMMAYRFCRQHVPLFPLLYSVLAHQLTCLALYFFNILDPTKSSG